jgi:hypothetical protein
MANIDKLVTSDLAALALHSQHPRRTVDDVLRTIQPLARPRVAAGAAVAELAGLRLAGVFAGRVARIAAGGLAAICAMTCVVLLFAPGFGTGTVEPAWWSTVFDRSAASVGVALAALWLATSTVAGAAARRRYERRLRGSPDAGVPGDAGARSPALVRSLDAWSVALVIAGVTSAVVVVGAMVLLLGWKPWYYPWREHAEVTAIFRDRLREVAIIVPGVTAAALLVGRACARSADRWLRPLAHRGTTGAGAVLGGVVLAVGATLDVGPMAWNAVSPAPSNPLRTALTVFGTIAVFLVVTGHVLRQRRRELAGIATAHDDGPAPSVLALQRSELVRLAGALSQDAARAAAGATAAVSAVAILVVLHGSFAPTDGADPGSLSDVLQRWLLRDRLPLVACLCVAGLGAHAIAARIAGRVFERALGRARRAESAAADPLAFARRLLQRIDGWSTGFTIAGAASIATLLGVAVLTVGLTRQLTAGEELWIWFQPHGERVSSVLGHALRELTIAIPLGFAAALAIGRACAREASTGGVSRWLRVLEHRDVARVAALGCLSALAMGLSLDFAADDISVATAAARSAAPQIAFAVIAASSVFLLTASVSLRRRRRRRDQYRESRATADPARRA